MLQPTVRVACRVWALAIGEPPARARVMMIQAHALGHKSHVPFCVEFRTWTFQGEAILEVRMFITKIKFLSGKAMVKF